MFFGRMVLSLASLLSSELLSATPSLQVGSSEGCSILLEKIGTFGGVEIEGANPQEAILFMD